MPVEVHRRIFEHMHVSCQIVLGPPVILSLSARGRRSRHAHRHGLRCTRRTGINFRFASDETMRSLMIIASKIQEIKCVAKLHYALDPIRPKISTLCACVGTQAPSGQCVPNDHNQRIQGDRFASGRFGSVARRD